MRRRRIQALASDYLEVVSLIHATLGGACTSDSCVDLLGRLSQESIAQNDGIFARLVNVYRAGRHGRHDAQMVFTAQCKERSGFGEAEEATSAPGLDSLNVVQRKTLSPANSVNVPNLDTLSALNFMPPFPPLLAVST